MPIMNELEASDTVHPNAIGSNGRSTSFLRKCLLSTIVAAIASYFLVCTYFFLGQRAMIYKPTTQWAGSPSDVGLPFEAVTIDDVPIHDRSVRISGWWIPASDTLAPAVLYLHGNKGNISDCLQIAKILHRTGASLLIVDYAGYGNSTPLAISEDTMRESGLAALSYLKRRVPEAAAKFVYGRSLGGAVAVEVAAKAGASINGLILESTFTSLPDEVRHLGYGWLPIGLLLHDHYPSLDQLGAIAVKHVLLVHGSNDSYVPASMSSRLALVAKGNVTTLMVPGAGHNDVDSMGSSALEQALREFLRSGQ
jgi:fermentation-respiration switch protein FrsA (DUF1100 family)